MLAPEVAHAGQGPYSRTAPVERSAAGARRRVIIALTWASVYLARPAGVIFSDVASPYGPLNTFPPAPRFCSTSAPLRPSGVGGWQPHEIHRFWHDVLHRFDRMQIGDQRMHVIVRHAAIHSDRHRRTYDRAIRPFAFADLSLLATIKTVVAPASLTPREFLGDFERSRLDQRTFSKLTNSASVQRHWAKSKRPRSPRYDHNMCYAAFAIPDNPIGSWASPPDNPRPKSSDDKGNHESGPTRSHQIHIGRCQSLESPPRFSGNRDVLLSPLERQIRRRRPIGCPLHVANCDLGRVR
jgi:hypothetical protein